MKLRSLAKWLVQRVLSGDRADVLLGDLEEERADHVRLAGHLHADLWYCREAVIAVIFYIAELTYRYLGNGRSIVAHEQRFGTVTVHVGRNGLALIAFGVTAFTFIQVTQHVSAGWRATELAQLSACAIGVLLALRLRAHVAALFLAGQVAFTVSEFAMHSAYSIRAVQGAPTHFAVMIAATLGALLGAILIALISRSTATARLASS